MNFTVQAIHAFIPKLEPIMAAHTEVISLPYDADADETPERAALRQKRHALMLALSHDERRMLAAYSKSLHTAAAALILFDDAKISEEHHDR